MFYRLFLPIFLIFTLNSSYADDDCFCLQQMDEHDNLMTLKECYSYQRKIDPEPRTFCPENPISYQDSEEVPDDREITDLSQWTRLAAGDDGCKSCRYGEENGEKKPDTPRGE